MGIAPTQVKRLDMVLALLRAHAALHRKASDEPAWIAFKLSISRLDAIALINQARQHERFLKAADEVTS